jgi:hypothetical protein
MSRDSSVGIERGYRLDDRVSIPGKGKIYFSITQGLDWLLGLTNLLFNKYRVAVSSGGKAAGA